MAIDRTSKYAIAQLHEQCRPGHRLRLPGSADSGLPSGLTRWGIQFAKLPKNRSGPAAMCRINRFGQIRREHDVEYRATKPHHW